MTSQQILITGGSGFLGQALIRYWLTQNHEITVLSRDPLATLELFGPKINAISSLKLLPATAHFDAVVNLAGSPIFGKRWSPARKQELRNSRIELTHQLVKFIEQMPVKPEVLLSGSAIGIYGNQGDTLLNEQSLAKADFSQQLCADWEHAALLAEQFGIRVCLIRTGLVLGNGGGLLSRMLPAFKLGLGGRLGNGLQWMSWIHRDDWVRIVDTLLHEKTLHGAFNATAPHPVTNHTFSQKLAKHLHRPACLPLAAKLLELLLGEMSELVLGSQRVIPQRLLEQQFVFNYPDLDQALQSIVNVK